jgi:hypothetical protein
LRSTFKLLAVQGILFPKLLPGLYLAHWFALEALVVLAQLCPLAPVWLAGYVDAETELFNRLARTDAFAEWTLEEEESEARYEEMVREYEGELGDKLKAPAPADGPGMGVRQSGWAYDQVEDKVMYYHLGFFVLYGWIYGHILGVLGESDTLKRLLTVAPVPAFMLIFLPSSRYVVCLGSSEVRWRFEKDPAKFSVPERYRGDTVHGGRR